MLFLFYWGYGMLFSIMHQFKFLPTMYHVLVNICYLHVSVLIICRSFPYNIYINLLSILKWIFLFIWHDFHEFFIYFEYWCLIIHIFCKYFLIFSKLSGRQWFILLFRAFKFVQFCFCFLCLRGQTQKKLKFLDLISVFCICFLLEVL